MAVTYRILFYIFLANSFESKAYVEAGLQKILANLNRDDFESAAIAAEKARVSSLFYRRNSLRSCPMFLCKSLHFLAVD